ncbi:FecR family protein [Variovorax sp. J22R133]|uniref:FecR family protein n=1 Tax=Variovorax brevis TaxID=3053503 RepID=UPI002574E612|nr:FecR family protein [Variovorax sp. J22R133]MDM0114899.1 FecR family protein [Variovorax sp. J22R133]
MKLNKNTLIGFAGALLISAPALAQAPAEPTAAAAAAAAPTPIAHAGFIKSVQGKVQLLSPSGEARYAKAGDPVAPIDRVVTDADSGASVVLRDGTTMVVGPSSQLDLKEFHFDSRTQDGGLFVALLRGSMRMITGLIGKTHPDAIRVDTQTATIGIRGTDFIVTADDKL